MRVDDTEIVLEPISEISTELIKHRTTSQIPNWRSVCLKSPFLIGAVTMTLLHSVMCAILIVYHYTDSSVFTFNASNAGAFLFWQFVPTILGVVPGLIWEVIYIEVCRSQPYRDLASPQGSTVKDSLSQTYLTSFSWFVPYNAWKHPQKHTAITMVSIAYLLSYALLPTVTIAMTKIQWNTDDSTDSAISSGTAQPLIYLIILSLAISVSVSAFGTAAFLVLRRPKSGVYGDPGSIAGLGALVAESNLLENFRSLRSYEIQEHIDKALGDLQVCLEHTNTSYQISLVDPSQTVPQLPMEDWQRDSNEAHPWWLRGKTYIGLLILTTVPLIVVCIVMYQQVVAAVNSNDPLDINGDAFAIKVCTAITTLINAALMTNWHLNVSLLQPYHKLADHIQGKLRSSSEALRMNYTGSAISNLLRPGQSFDVWLVAVSALLTELSVIIRPAVFSNLGFILALGLKDSSNTEVSELFQISIPAGVAPLRVIMYIFEGFYVFVTLIGFLLVMTSKRKPFLPRKPYTLSSTILYICHSTDLLDDLKGMSTIPKKARDTRLSHNGHRYAIGWMKDEGDATSRVGIDRVENIEKRFKYPKRDPADDARNHLTAEAHKRLHGTDNTRTRRAAGWPENAQ